MRKCRHFRPDCKFSAWHFYLCLLRSAFCLSLAAAEIDESKLAPPATGKIDFTRDIKPILDNSCLRCHGPERPRSRFRLDNRESALKGGAKGVDILPGNSAKSPLIHNVSRLVEDMEMPPSGKGKPLTDQQIGLLRAWIDQGVAWEATATNKFTFSTSLELGGTSVHGDAHKFREHYWQKNGVNGGAQEFEMSEQTSPDTTVSVTGHALLDDYKVNLFLDKSEFGFIHTGFEQYRKYYDDTGGYYPAFSPSTYRLGRDLHLELGKAWIDFGLTLPDWPRLVLGYEYDYRRGDEAVTQWGSVTQGAFTRNIAPASKEIDERVHVIKFNLDHEIQGVLIEESFRGEFYNLNTRQTNNSITYGASDAREGYSYFQGANTIRLEKQVNDWLLGSAGYLYSKLDADATFSLDTINPFVDQRWRAPEIALERESHVVNLNSLLGPFDGLTISAGVQSEWTRQKGLGSANFDEVIPLAPPLTLANPATFSSDYDKSSVQENLALRYTKIPFTTLFAEARLEQQRIGQSD
ncbi:MAG TPA: c-type cytochrome domain-containing protein, partial [Verrucomicrobiae bacterium]|nr:c-type cytochrome domain-containing protein [Verrucomicrobiae bacterium]